MFALWNSPRRVVERILAVVLALAACLKAHDFLVDFNPYPVGPFDGRLLISILIGSELLLALWLMVGGFDRPRFLGGFVCFCLFSVITFHEASQAIPSCGCFGRAKVPPAITGCFDLSAVIALWMTRPKRTVPVAPRSFRRIFASAIALLLLASAAFSSSHIHRLLEAKTHGEPVVMEPDSWLNQPFPLLNSIDGGAQLRTGRWLLVLYHFDCDACRHAIPKYRAIAQAMRSQINPPHMAFVAIPPLASASQDPGYATPDVLHFSLPSNREWIATTPVVVFLREGRVNLVSAGEQAANPPEVPQ
jgi:methylamine utilization protein MauE